MVTAGKIVVDTSIFVDYIRSKKGILPELMKLASKKQTTLYVASVVILELWAGLSMNDDDIYKKVKRLVKVAKVINLTGQLAESSGELRRKKEVIGNMDAVVAATALYLGAELATNNKKHFEKVPGLKLFKLL